MRATAIATVMAMITGMHDAINNMKRIFAFSGMLGVSSFAVWITAGRYYSYRATSHDGEFLYNAGVSPFMQILFSLAYGLAFSLVIAALSRLPKKAALPLISLFSVLFVGFLMANWLFGARPDIRYSDHVDIVPITSGQGAGTVAGTGSGQATSSGVGSSSSAFMASVWKTYEHPDWKLGFDVPAGLDIRTISTTTRQTLLGPIDFNYGSEFAPDSIEIPGLFIVSKISYSTLAKNPIVDWHSCCSGIRYWYDVGKGWRAQAFENVTESAQSGSGAGEVVKKTKPHSLVEFGRCSIEERFGAHYFYKIISTEEGIPIDISYFLNTDKGYAIRFSSLLDIRDEIAGNTANVAPAVSDTPNAMSRILESVDVGSRTGIVRAGCM